MDVRLRVHIAPIGFEVRRIADPLIRMRADVVYLVSLDQNDKAGKFMKEIRRILKEESPQIDIREESTNLWDLFTCLAKYKEIFNKERKNEIFVNVSTGSKVAAISGTLACMLWGGVPYYAKLDYGNELPENIKPEKVGDIQDVPTFTIKTPRPEILKALRIIDSKGGKVSKKVMIQELVALGVIRPVKEPELTEAAKHSQLRVLIDPMKNEFEYVEVESRGRTSIVHITKEGKNALRVFGTD
jgi:hypothetical protein